MIPMVIARMTKELDGPTRIDLIAHSVEAPTVSYSTTDNQTFRNCASGITQEDPQILDNLRALVAEWTESFSQDRFGRKV